MTEDVVHQALGTRADMTVDKSGKCGIMDADRDANREDVKNESLKQGDVSRSPTVGTRIVAPPPEDEDEQMFTFNEEGPLGLEFEDLSYPFRIIFLHDGTVKRRFPEFPIPSRLIGINNVEVRSDTDWDEHVTPHLRNRPLSLKVQKCADDQKVAEDEEISSYLSAFSGKVLNVGDKLSGKVLNVGDKLVTGLSNLQKTSLQDSEVGIAGDDVRENGMTAVVNQNLVKGVGGFLGKIGNASISFLQPEDSPVLSERGYSAIGALTSINTNEQQDTRAAKSTQPLAENNNGTSVTLAVSEREVCNAKNDGTVRAVQTYDKLPFLENANNESTADEPSLPQFTSDQLTSEPAPSGEGTDVDIKHKSCEGEIITPTEHAGKTHASLGRECPADLPDLTESRNPCGETLNTAPHERPVSELSPSSKFQRKVEDYVYTVTIFASGPLGLEFQPFIDEAHSVYVKSISSAEDAAVRALGIRVGDQLTHLNNLEVAFESLDALTEVLNTMRPVLCTFKRQVEGAVILAAPSCPSSNTVAFQKDDMLATPSKTSKTNKGGAFFVEIIWRITLIAVKSSAFVVKHGISRACQASLTCFLKCVASILKKGDGLERSRLKTSWFFITICETVSGWYVVIIITESLFVFRTFSLLHVVHYPKCCNTIRRIGKLISTS